MHIFYILFVIHKYSYPTIIYSYETSQSAAAATVQCVVVMRVLFGKPFFLYVKATQALFLQSR